MKTKAKGARRELQCLHSLEKEGYICTKAGASLGAFDVIAVPLVQESVPHGELSYPISTVNPVRLIQVKSNRCPKKEKEYLKSLIFPYFVRKELWIYKDREGLTVEVL